MLNCRHKSLLRDMLAQLITCWQRKQPEKILLESAFMLTQRYCEEVKQLVWNTGFVSEMEEIDFYKNVQLQFSGRLLYYSIVYESVLSSPNDHEAASDFWEKELERHERFREKNESLVTYCDEERTDQDEYYFLRKHTTDKILLREKLLFACYEEGTLWSVSVARYYAEKCYRLFVLSRMAINGSK
jgi:hypothetical protein